MRISRREKVRKEEVKQHMEIERSIINDVEKKQLIWYGHVQRMNENKLLKQIMEWIFPGRGEEDQVTKIKKT